MFGIGKRLIKTLLVPKQFDQPLIGVNLGCGRIDHLHRLFVIFNGLCGIALPFKDTAQPSQNVAHFGQLFHLLHNIHAAAIEFFGPGKLRKRQINAPHGRKRFGLGHAIAQLALNIQRLLQHIQRRFGLARVGIGAAHINTDGRLKLQILGLARQIQRFVVDDQRLFILFLFNIDIANGGEDAAFCRQQVAIINLGGAGQAIHNISPHAQRLLIESQRLIIFTQRFVRAPNVD